MKRNRSSCDAVLATAVALVLLAGCKPPAATTAGTEGAITQTHNGVRLALGARTLALTSASGSALTNVGVLIAGKVYQARDGKLQIDDAAGREALKQGNFVLVAPGFVPRKVTGGDTDLALVPMSDVRATGTLGGAATKLTLPGRGLEVVVPGGLAASSGQAGLAAYVPPASAAEDARAKADRDAFLAGHHQAGCDAPLPCPPAEARLGLVLESASALAGGQLQAHYDLAAMARGWDGRDPAPWAANAGAWPEDARQAALAAVEIRKVYAAIDATGDPSWRADLASKYGLTLVNGVLTFPVRLGDNSFSDGYARIEVDGLSLLGVRLEVTVISGAGGTGSGDLLGASGFQAPPGGTGTTLPGTNALARLSNTGTELLLGQLAAHIITHDGGSIITHDGGSIRSHGGDSLITNDGGSLITNDGGSLITNDGGSIITHDGGSLITNDGGSLITNDGGSLTGVARLPDGLDTSANAGTNGTGGTNVKYRLTSYGDAPWANTKVFASHLGLNAEAVVTDAAGAYTISGLPPSRAKVMPIAIKNGLRLATVAEAPRGNQVNAPQDAATTGVTLVVLKRAGTAGVQTVNMAGFAADVAWLRTQMNLSQAQDVVRKPFDVGSALVDGIFTGAGHALASLPLLPPPPPPPLVVTPGPMGLLTNPAFRYTPGYAYGPTAPLNQYNSPKGLGVAAGVLLIADYGNNLMRTYNPSFNMFFDQTGVAQSPDFPPPLGGIPAYIWHPREMVYDLRRGQLYMVEGDESGTGQALHWIRGGDGLANRNFGVIAGDVAPGSVDGIGTTARFNLPEGLAISADCRYLYVADRLNHKIRQVDLDNGNVVITLAGSGTRGYTDGPAGQATFNEPRGLALDGAGNLFVSDWGNHAIRRIALDGTVTTIVGNGTLGNGIGTGAATKLSGPIGLAYAADAGCLFVADAGNNRILYINPAAPYDVGVLAQNGGPADATGGELLAPAHLTVAGVSRTLYATTQDHAVRKITY
ncbi:MAG: repeat containing protein [Cyanobacteria bacterium RYN_339]|nr:repeat containing protein [Cyanobacteria bacterium RYN_339]